VDLETLQKAKAIEARIDLAKDKVERFKDMKFSRDLTLSTGTNSRNVYLSGQAQDELLDFLISKQEEIIKNALNELAKL